MKVPISWLERVAIMAASLVISVGLIALLSGFFAARDQAGVTGASPGPGFQFRDQGNAHLRLGQPHPRYDSNPPTSGPHVPVAVVRDQTRLSNDQLLEALALGDVVIMYGAHRPPQGLVELARSIAGRFSPALAADGQAVILAQRPGTLGLIGLAWTRMVQVSAPNDSLLGDFARVWLGRGAPGR